MESEGPLSQLADIHLPDPVSFWPLAPGWWLLIALGVVLCIWLIIRALRKLVWRKRLQAAQRELDKAIATYRQVTAKAEADHNQAGLDYLYAVNSVLNRVALYIDRSNARQIASLHGNAWLNYLDQAYGGNEFTEGDGKVLAEGQYRPVFAGEIEGLYTLSQRWINTCYKNDARQNKKQAAGNRQKQDENNKQTTHRARS